ncbi:MAG: hypothetical protein HDT14_12700 [Oscillibacter sp.]|nr:hypothetical protein [Oscillibacter sp.]
MGNYKKAYALLLGEIDKALTLLDTDNLLEFDHVREILLHAVQNAEEIFVGDENY